ncbi:DUF4232 domain-containing protein [Streptomyces sp. NPDC001380]|uniref:DUF4232 domain-containing protein n=1 Tax=Streptomyces sp. NPDC001380 TaxID=3364566 RepID=UPI0036B32415
MRNTLSAPRRLAAAASAAALGLTGLLTAAGPAQAAPAAVPTCTTGSLHLSMGRQDPGAGQLYQPIRFTNTGTRSCALRGYPGVSVLDAARRPIGALATRSGAGYGTVTVRPGRTVTAVLHTTNGPIGGPCRPTGSYLRVYPPGSYRSVLVPTRYRVCSGVFQVSPVTSRSS